MCARCLQDYLAALLDAGDTDDLLLEESLVDNILQDIHMVGSAVFEAMAEIFIQHILYILHRNSCRAVAPLLLALLVAEVVVAQLLPEC